MGWVGSFMGRKLRPGSISGSGLCLQWVGFVSTDVRCFTTETLLS